MHMSAKETRHLVLLYVSFFIISLDILQRMQNSITSIIHVSIALGKGT